MEEIKLLESTESEIFKGCINQDLIPDNDLVIIFELIRDKLNLQTIRSFSIAHNLSYNGVRFQKNLRTHIMDREYIVDNENV